MIECHHSRHLGQESQVCGCLKCVMWREIQRPSSIKSARILGVRLFSYIYQYIGSIHDQMGPMESDHLKFQIIVRSNL